jgi:hypothetical protein
LPIASASAGRRRSRQLIRVAQAKLTVRERVSRPDCFCSREFHELRDNLT